MVTTTVASLALCLLGVLAVGTCADFVAMPGDPIAEISVTANVDFVRHDGALSRTPEDVPPLFATR